MEARGLKIKLIALLAIVLALSGLPSATQAFAIKTYSNLRVDNDFVIGPGKVEVFLEPGQSITRDLNVTNRSGRVVAVKIGIEDFTGSPEGSAKLLDNERGPYSLKDYLKPEKMDFQLAHGEMATLPVTINIPADAEPGGLYGAIIVRVEPPPTPAAGGEPGAKGNVSLTTRLASLFFVRVKGEVKEEGSLKTFKTNKKFYKQSPVNFSIIYENTGRVHNSPYAEIEIKNLAGRSIDKINISPWFVMPGFTRDRQIAWDKSLAFGRYTAELLLHRNYGGLEDRASVTFWIIPLKAVLWSLAIIFILAVLIWLVTSKFELKRKVKDNQAQ